MMKKIAVLGLALTLSVPAMADQQLIDGVIGAVVGGGMGRWAGRNTTTAKRNMITAAGALGGAWVGSRIGDDSGQRHQDEMNMRSRELQERQYQYDNDRNSGYSGGSGGYRNSRTVAPVDVSYSQPSQTNVYFENSGSMPTQSRSARWEDQEAVVETPRTRRYRDTPPPASVADCMSEYRDPQAAQAYCEGRAAYIRQAYERGMSGR